MPKVYAPSADYEGLAAGVQFRKGVGETDNVGALAYFRRAGYGIDGPAPVVSPLPSIDSREIPLIVEQPPSRDAAVEKRAAGPVSDAFLPPINAGEADPHGPLVVSPGLHAVPPAPIAPGPVEAAPEQEVKETELAEAVLVEHVLVPEATGAGAPPGGPLGASDAGSVGEGPDAAMDPPARNAGVAAWRSYAIAAGMDPAEAEGANRAELIERYGRE